MKELPLQEYYEVCGMTIPITRKTGHLVEKRPDGGYEFARDDGSDEQRFSLTPNVHLESDIGLALNHRVTMALFQYGGFFLLLNHNTDRFKYYPAAVEDLFHRLPESDGGFRQLRNQRTLREQARTFDKSRTFLATLDKCRLL